VPKPPHPQPHSPRRLRYLRWLILALVCWGLVGRCWNLGGKVYWHDEAFTSLVIAGQPGRYFNAALFRQQVVSPAQVLAYQQIQPPPGLPELGWGEVIRRQGQEDSQHPPLYYLLLRLWAQVWGSSVPALRSFSVLGSLLVLPAVYGLARELFAHPRAPGIAVALLAVSPLQWAYAQETREYALWMAMILAGSMLLLRARRLGSWQAWGLYGLAMLVGLYTALFTLLVGFGHGLYLAGLRSNWRYLSRFGVIWAGVILGFAPWLLVMGQAAQQVGDSTSWAAVPLALGTAIQLHVANYSRSFVDFNLGFGRLTPNWRDDLGLYLGLPILGLQIGTLVWLWRQAPRQVAWFLITLLLGTALPLGVRDVGRGGQLATVTRYLFPCFLSLQLMVVYWLTSFRQQGWQRRFTNGVLVGLIGLGIASGVAYSQSQTWWNKVLNSNYPQLAAQINRSPNPLVISDAYSYNPASVIALSYLLKPEVQLLLLPAVGATMPVQELPATTTTVFLLNLPPPFRNQFRTQFQDRLPPENVPENFRDVFADPWNQVWQASLTSPRNSTPPSPPKESLRNRPATPRTGKMSSAEFWAGRGCQLGLG
jgi:uncharacterized membrane protein